MIVNQLFSPDEIKTALELHRAENIVLLKLKKKLLSIDMFIIATGKTPRHLRNMSDTIVKGVSLHSCLWNW